MPWWLLQHDIICCITMQELLILSARQVMSPRCGWHVINTLLQKAKIAIIVTAPVVSPSPKQPPMGADAPPQDSSRRRNLSGLLVFSGSGSPPKIKFFAPHHKMGKQVSICRNFLWEGFSCPMHACDFAHVPNLRGCDDKVVAEFVQFVSRNKHVAWATGKAPPTDPKSG